MFPELRHAGELTAISSQAEDPAPANLV